jgi:hypothetical protein
VPSAEFDAFEGVTRSFARWLQTLQGRMCKRGGARRAKVIAHLASTLE